MKSKTGSWLPGHHYLLPQVYKEGTALAPSSSAPFKETNPEVKEPGPLPNNFPLEPQRRSGSVKGKEEGEEQRGRSC